MFIKEHSTKLSEAQRRAEEKRLLNEAKILNPGFFFNLTALFPVPRITKPAEDPTTQEVIMDEVPVRPMSE